MARVKLWAPFRHEDYKLVFVLSTEQWPEHLDCFEFQWFACGEQQQISFQLWRCAATCDYTAVIDGFINVVCHLWPKTFLRMKSYIRRWPECLSLHRYLRDRRDVSKVVVVQNSARCHQWVRHRQEVHSCP